jgi:hypothetical protein
METTSSNPSAKPSSLNHPALQGSHYLNHLLSPLEQAALAAGFEAFSYPVDGLHLHISGAVAANLRHIYALRLILCEQFAEQARELYEEAGPAYAPFLSQPLSELGLSTRLRHLLLRAQCDTLLDVARLGPKGLSSVRGFGPGALEELRRVFASEGYEDLLQ